MLTEIIHKTKSVLPYYEAIVRNKNIQINNNPEHGLYFHYTKDGLSIKERIFIKNAFDAGLSSIITTFLMSNLIVNGPKVFRPKVETIEALDNMTLNVQFEHYHQPFPTIVVEFPENYSKKYTTGNPVRGEMPGDFYGHEIHEPKHVILHHIEEFKVICAGVQYSSSTIFNCLILPKVAEQTLEDALQNISTLESYEGSLETTNEETRISVHAMRVALNCVLAMEDFGIKKIGPVNPSHYNRCVRRCKGKFAEANQREIAQHPIVYSFDQNIKLYESLNTVGTETHREGMVISPHWRRGHFRMQHFGVNNSQSKRIRILPVLVNKHLFAGKPSNTNYTSEL